MTLERAIVAAAGGDLPDLDNNDDAALTPVEAVTPPAPPDSVIGQLRQRAAQLRTQRTIELPIPGYGGALWGRYHAVSAPRTFADRNGAPRNVMGDWRVAADTLAVALDGLYGRNGQDPLEPLAHDVDVRFDDDLVTMLDLDVHERTARAVIVALMGGGELGESRVWSHFLQYQNWLLSGSEDSDGVAPEVADLLGEYRAT